MRVCALSLMYEKSLNEGKRKGKVSEIDDF